MNGTVQMNGWSATWVTEGTGRPCIVLSLRHYHPRSFSARFKSEFRCTFLDVRFSAPDAAVDERDPYTVAAAVEDLELARKALGLDRFVLVGHSIQGSMALAYALRYPQHVSHLIAICAVPEVSPAQAATTAAYWDGEASSERKAAFEVAQKALAAAAPGLAPANAVAASIHADAAKRCFDVNFDERPLLAGAPFNMPVAMQLFQQPFALFTGEARMEPPVFLAAGRHDYAAPPPLWDGYRDRFRDLTFSLFEQSGHTPQVEEPATFDERVITWIRSR